MSDSATPVVGESVFELQLGNFSGPLDFLLELVKVNKIEIKDIFVSQVTEQFLQYMTQLSTLDVDQASEYMAISATLLEIKSKSLLPIDIDADNEGESAQALLIRQIEEYKLFKEIVSELKVQESVNRFYREPDQSVGKEAEVLGENLSLEGFMSAFNKFLARMQAKSGAEEVSRAITKETFSVTDKIRFIRSALIDNETIRFSSLFLATSSKTEIVTTFSAVLEMLKMQLICVKQSNLFDDFDIVPNNLTMSDEEITQSLSEETDEPTE